MSTNSLVVKYKPKRLDDILGQPKIVRRLKQFVREPHSAALIFAGNSGVGKTAAAECLARELGVAVDEQEMGGYHSIASGKMLGEHVEQAMLNLRFVPFYGSGFRVLTANEADRATMSAETIWLDALEHLPSRCVIVFTTNNYESMTQRFRDRCESFQFEGRSQLLGPHIQALCRRVWLEECGPEIPPAFGSKIGMPTLGSPDSMNCSFRMALQQLTSLIRDAKERSPNAEAKAYA